MVINFANIDFDKRPVLILKRADGTPVGSLGYARNVALEPKYNELSVLSFELPAVVDGVQVPFYEELTGQKIIEMNGIGQFVVSEPEESGDTVTLHKTVSAKSLEAEFSRKQIALPDSTYKFWDSEYPDGTMLGMIMEVMPNWEIGDISGTIAAKFRTFSVAGDNLYNCIKGTVQKAYNCIFEFDTLRRRVNVRDADNTPAQKQVYISRENLAKDIHVTEKTDDLITKLEVNGSDGVDIREVNPTGDNAIINLDYYMTPDNFSPELIERYTAWKELVDENRTLFYNYALQYAVLVSAETTERAKLTDLRGEYTSIDNIRGVTIQGIAQGLKHQEDLNEINEELAMKQEEIDAKIKEINDIVTERAEVMGYMTDVRDQCAFSSYFTEEEQKAMDAYIIENAVTETTFVASEIQSYTDGAGNNIENETVSITGAEIEETVLANGEIYTVNGGTINAANITTGLNISAVFEHRVSNEEDKITLSIFSGQGEFNGTIFPSGCISVSGYGTITRDGNDITCSVTNAYLYFSMNASDFAKKTVAWELYDYGYALLEKMSRPSYSFSVSSANFLALDQFILFKNELELGQRVYVKIGEDQILKPLCTGASIRYGDKTSFSLTFNDTFTANDGQAKLIEVLDTSVSMGKKLSSGQYTYQAWTKSGASATIHDFITSALDTAVNAIKSSTDQAVTWDGAGLKLLKYADEEHTRYEGEQIWMSNNSILMSDDGWDTAKLAIGKFVDGNLGEKWGIVAPMIVGTMIAGNELVIESEKKSGDEGTAVFRMDGDGCRLYNSQFIVEKIHVNTETEEAKTTQIRIDPDYGIVIGEGPVIDEETGEIDPEKAKFYADDDGNLHLAGRIDSHDGLIGGWIIDANGLRSGEDNPLDGTSTYVGLSSHPDNEYSFWAGNSDPTIAPFAVKKDGSFYSVKGKIGEWYLDSDYIGDTDTLKASECGIRLARSVDEDTVIFWAGGQPYLDEDDLEGAIAPFRVYKDGTLVADNARITGGIIAQEVRIGNAGDDDLAKIDKFIENIATKKDDEVVKYIEGKGYMLQADFDAFEVDYYTSTQGLMTKTQYIQDDGHIELSAVGVTGEDGEFTTCSFSLDSSGNIIMSGLATEVRTTSDAGIVALATAEGNALYVYNGDDVTFTTAYNGDTYIGGTLEIAGNLLLDGAMGSLHVGDYVHGRYWDITENHLWPSHFSCDLYLGNDGYGHITADCMSATVAASFGGDVWFTTATLHSDIYDFGKIKIGGR